MLHVFRKDFNTKDTENSERSWRYSSVISNSLLCALCVESLILFVATATTADAQTILDYGRECAAKIAAIEPFDCRAGTPMPVTVNGQIVPYQPNMTCDRPSLLPYSEPGSQGQCIPFSRVLVLRDDGQAQIVAACREKVIRPADTYWFDEVDIISHSVSTGSTCWFQAKAAEPLARDRGLDGRRVPPPEESVPPPGRPAAVTFWRTPEDTAAEKCVACHDSDPFMYSPFVAQTGKMPRDPFGYYANDIGAAFKAWPKPIAISTRGNTCVGCHRIGSLATCHTTMYQAVGLQPVSGADTWAQKFPQSHWMPPGYSLTEKEWNLVYQDAVKQLAACCNAPDAPGCKKDRIGSRE